MILEGIVIISTGATIGGTFYFWRRNQNSDNSTTSADHEPPSPSSASLADRLRRLFGQSTTSDKLDAIVGTDNSVLVLFGDDNKPFRIGGSEGPRLELRALQEEGGLELDDDDPALEDAKPVSERPSLRK